MTVQPDGDQPGPRVRAPVFIQRWEPTAFLHWPVEVADVARLLPPGCEPDTYDGVTYVGLIPLVIRGVRVFGAPPLPRVSTFTELNVRLYSVDADGRRGIVFCSLDAERLVPVIAAQSTYRLPYKWSRMSYRHSGDEHTWTSMRRWPGPVGARAHVRIRVGPPIAEPDGLTLFLTTRWALHTVVRGRTAYAVAQHDPWPLHRATVLDLDEDVIAAAGLPAPAGEPHVVFSPGVSARIGPPISLARRRHPTHR
ncbi:MAG: DUF2071 domain-containing protein [Actinomycetota bacterium]|nr:DUF2071 domain-containing protein [Actinomycetota bacterium]